MTVGPDAFSHVAGPTRAGDSRPTRASGSDVSEHQRSRRVLEDACDIGEEDRALLAVDQAVVEGQREGGDPARDDLVVHHPRLLADRAEGEDRGLARVDDRGAGVDAEDADVGDRERAAGLVGRLGLALAGRGDQVVQRRAELGQGGGSAFLMFGTISPRGVAAAMPRLTAP